MVTITSFFLALHITGSKTVNEELPNTSFSTYRPPRWELLTNGEDSSLIHAVKLKWTESHHAVCLKILISSPIKEYRQRLRDAQNVLKEWRTGKEKTVGWWYTNIHTKMLAFHHCSYGELHTYRHTGTELGMFCLYWADVWMTGWTSTETRYCA